MRKGERCGLREDNDVKDSNKKRERDTSSPEEKKRAFLFSTYEQNQIAKKVLSFEAPMSWKVIFFIDSRVSRPHVFSSFV